MSSETVKKDEPEAPSAKRPRIEAPNDNNIGAGGDAVSLFPACLNIFFICVLFSQKKSLNLMQKLRQQCLKSWKKFKKI